MTKNPNLKWEIYGFYLSALDKGKRVSASDISNEFPISGEVGLEYIKMLNLGFCSFNVYKNWKKANKNSSQIDEDNIKKFENQFSFERGWSDYSNYYRFNCEKYYGRNNDADSMQNKLKNNLSDILITFLNNTSITQERLSEISGINAASISDYIAKRVLPSKKSSIVKIFSLINRVYNLKDDLNFSYEDILFYDSSQYWNERTSPNINESIQKEKINTIGSYLLSLFEKQNVFDRDGLSKKLGISNVNLEKILSLSNNTCNRASISVAVALDADVSKLQALIK